MDLNRLMTRCNGAIVWLLRSRLHAVLDPGLMLITVTGRRSGRRYTIPVGYQRRGNRVHVLVSKARSKQWWRNFLEEGPVEVRLAGVDRHGRARVIAPGSAEFVEAFETTLARLPWLGPQFGIRCERGKALTTAQLGVLARENAAVEIILD